MIPQVLERATLKTQQFLFTWSADGQSWGNWMNKETNWRAHLYSYPLGFGDLLKWWNGEPCGRFGLDKILTGWPFLDKDVNCVCMPFLDLGKDVVRSTRTNWNWEDEIAMSLRFCNGFRACTTSLILGLDFGSRLRHWAARWPAFCAPFTEKWPSRRGSIIWKKVLRSPSTGLAHSTRLCSPFGLFLSIDRRPVSISSSTTPKLYTSLFVVKCPDQNWQFRSKLKLQVCNYAKGTSIDYEKTWQQFLKFYFTMTPSWFEDKNHTF